MLAALLRATASRERSVPPRPGRGQSRFALGEAQVGLAAAAGSSRLGRTLPQKLAAEKVLTGCWLSADEALQHGPVHRVLPAGTAPRVRGPLAQEGRSASPT